MNRKQNGAAISSVKTRIGSVADDLNLQLQRAEDELRRKGFGVYAGVVLETYDSDDGSDQGFEEICFGKRDGSWQLYLQHGLSGDPDTWNTNDLFTSSLETRVRAAENIPALVEALENAACKREQDIVATTAKLSEFLDKLSVDTSN
jgi:hypothetical protein